MPPGVSGWKSGRGWLILSGWLPLFCKCKMNTQLLWGSANCLRERWFPASGFRVHQRGKGPRQTAVLPSAVRGEPGVPKYSSSRGSCCCNPCRDLLSALAWAKQCIWTWFSPLDYQFSILYLSQSPSPLLTCHLLISWILIHSPSRTWSWAVHSLPVRCSPHFQSWMFLPKGITGIVESSLWW